MSLEMIAAETKKDKTLRAVLEALRTNNWYDARIKEELPLNNLYKTLHKCKDEISMYKDEIILKGSKIVIPETIQQQLSCEHCTSMSPRNQQNNSITSRKGLV